MDVVAVEVNEMSKVFVAEVDADVAAKVNVVVEARVEDKKTSS